LQWLPVLVALVVGAVRSMRRGREVSGQLWPVVRTYGELAGRIVMWRRPRSCA
jgi:hypothetical protein